MRSRLRRNPFALVGLLGLLAFGVLVLAPMPIDSVAGQVVLTLLHTAGAGFYVAANLLARHLPDIPGWLDVALILGLGAAPYLLADAALHRGVRLTTARRGSGRPGTRNSPEIRKRREADRGTGERSTL